MLDCVSLRREHFSAKLSRFFQNLKFGYPSRLYGLIALCGATLFSPFNGDVARAASFNCALIANVSNQSGEQRADLVANSCTTNTTGATSADIRGIDNSLVVQAPRQDQVSSAPAAAAFVNISANQGIGVGNRQNVIMNVNSACSAGTEVNISSNGSTRPTFEVVGNRTCSLVITFTFNGAGWSYTGSVTRNNTSYTLNAATVATTTPPLTTTQAVASTTLNVGTAATAFTPVTASGGTAPVTLAVSPTLPAGLSFSTSTGQITGTPAAFSSTTTYTVTATDSTSGTPQTSSKTFSMTVNKGNQTVSFTSTAPSSPVVGGTYVPTATATSGLTPVITVDAASAAICSISSGTVTLNAAGSCVLNANQPGNANYNAALQVQQIMTTGKASPTVGLVASTSSPLFGTPVSLTATVTGGVTPTGTITFKDGATVLGTVALSGASASLSTSALTAGSHSITATYSGDAKNSVASSAATVLAVGSRPNAANDATVRGIVTSQVASAIRFGQAQNDNITNRFQQLHDDDDNETSTSSSSNTSGTASGFADTRADGRTFANRFNATSAATDTVSSSERIDNVNDTFSDLLRYDATRQKMSENPLGAMAYADDPVIVGNKTTQNDSSRAMSQLASSFPQALNALNKASGLPFQIWASGAVGFGRFNNEGSTSNRSTTSSLTVGVDGKIAENFKAGVALGMAMDRSTIGSDGSRNDSKSYSAALYSSWRFMPRTYLDLTGGVASLRSDVTRFDMNGGLFLNGRRDGTNLFGSVALTHNERYGAWKISPYIRIDAVQTTLNSYSETGANIWALSYDRMTANTINGVAGSRISYTIPQAWGTLTPSARFEYRHAFESNFSQALNYADLVGIAPGYTVAGTSLSRDAFTTALTMKADMINGWKADFEYLVTASSLGVEGQRFRLIGGYRF